MTDGSEDRSVNRAWRCLWVGGSAGGGGCKQLRRGTRWRLPGDGISLSPSISSQQAHPLPISQELHLARGSG